jgi:tetratricopeptide (TPR) repeat protein
MVLPLIGREPELEEFRSLLSQGRGVAGYYGLPGIGKSALLRAFEQECLSRNFNAPHRPRIITALLNVQNHVDAVVMTEAIVEKLVVFFAPQELPAPLSNFVEEVGNLKNQFLPHVNQTVVISEGSSGSNISQTVVLSDLRRQLLEAVLHQLTKLLQELADLHIVCLLFDTLEQASSEIRRSLEYLAGSCGDKVVIVGAGRYPTVLLRSRLDAVPLSKLRDSLRRIVFDLDGEPQTLPEETVDMICRLTKGHGLCLQLLLSHILLSGERPTSITVSNGSDAPPAILVDHFWHNILREFRLRGEELGNEGLLYQKAYAVLQIAPSLFEFSPSLIFDVFQQVPALEGTFANLADVYACVSDPTVRVYVSQTSSRPQFHDLIRQLGDSGLRRDHPELHADIHRVAAEHYIDLIRAQVKDTTDGSHDEWFVRPLEPCHAPFGLRSVVWGKKRWDVRDVWPKLRWDRLYSFERVHDNWRYYAQALAYHLFQYSEWLGTRFVDNLFVQATSRRETPFFNQLVELTRYVDVKSPVLDAWLVYLRNVFRAPDPEEELDKEAVSNLEDLLARQITSELAPILSQAGYWLLRYYSRKREQAKKYDSLLNRLLLLGEKLPYAERSAFWREIAYICLRCERTSQGFDLLEKSLQYAIEDREKASSLLRLGIETRRAGLLKASMKYLEQSQAVWAALGDEIGMGETYIALGDLYTSQGDTQQAHALYETARTILQRHFDSAIHGVNRLHLGSLIVLAEGNAAKAKLSQGEENLALEHLERALEVGDYLIPERKGRLVEYAALAAELYHRQGHSFLSAEKYGVAARISQERGDISAYGDYLHKQMAAYRLCDMNQEADVIAQSLSDLSLGNFSSSRSL